MRFLSLLSGGLVLLTTTTASFGGDKEIEPEVGFEIELRDRYLATRALWRREPVSSLDVRKHTEKVIDRIHEEIVEESSKQTPGEGAIIPSPFANPPNVDENFTTYLVRGPNDQYTTSGPWIAYTTDPFVMELKGKKLPLSKLEEYESVFEEQLFQRPARHGFKPSWFSNSTHFTLDWVTTFGRYPLSSLENGLDFFVDWANQGFSSGTLNYDPANALGFRSSKVTTDLTAGIIGEVRAALFKKDYRAAALNFNKIANSFIKIQIPFVGSSSPYEIRVSIDFEEDEEGNTVISEDSKMELRGFRGVENFHEVVQLAKLVTTRAKFLQKRKKEGAPPISFDKTPVGIHIADTAGFERFVKETGLRWSEYEAYAKRAYNPCNIALTPLKLLLRPRSK